MARSVSLAGDVIRALRQTLRRETKAVSDHVMATAISVGTHVAEGYGRHSVQEQRTSYIEAKCALLRLETELAVARHAELMPAGAFTDLTQRTALVARLLAGYLVYLDRQISDQEAAPPRNARGGGATGATESTRAPTASA